MVCEKSEFQDQMLWKIVAYIIYKIFFIWILIINNICRLFKNTRWEYRERKKW